MFIVKNVKMIWSEPKLPGRTYHGVFNKGNNFYTSLVHGSPFGAMDLETLDNYISVTPDTIRNQLAKFTGIAIPINFPLYICSCHSYYVNERWEKEFKKNNIHLIGRWKSQTCFTICDNELVFQTKDLYHNVLDFSPKGKILNLIIYSMSSRTETLNLFNIMRALSGRKSNGITVI